MKFLRLTVKTKDILNKLLSQLKPDNDGKEKRYGFKKTWKVDWDIALEKWWKKTFRKKRR